MLFRPSPAELPIAPRRPLRDNSRVLIAVVLILVGVLVGLYFAAGRASLLAPGDFSEVVVYTLSAVVLALLAAMLFVLARNIIKLVGERRRAIPFARFRGKLVAALLAMALIPALLVLVIGSEVIRSSAERWFSEPVDEVLGAAQTIAREYYAEHNDAVIARADRRPHIYNSQSLAPENLPTLNLILQSEMTEARRGGSDLYRVTSAPPGLPDATWIVGKQWPAMPRDMTQASADRLAARAIASGHTERADEPVHDGVVIRVGEPIQNETGVVVGAIVMSELLSNSVTTPARIATNAYDQYKQLRVFKDPITRVYLTFFLMVTLLILISAIWLGLYVAKRITRPVQMLAEGARAIGAGQLDFRLEAESGDEMGSLIEAFNVMAAELRTSKERLEESQRELEHRNTDVEARRRYIETILERVATGVISIGADGRIATFNGAASRLLGLGPEIIGQAARALCEREELRPLAPIIEATDRRETGGVVEEITLARDDREIHLAVAATALIGEAGTLEGAVIVLDDVTPLIRTQRVAAWRDVARRLAHEIKNPLTPIQLSAERLQRNFSNAPPNARRLVDECTGAIVAEVEALKNLVDEFAQFARMRGPRAVPCDLNTLIAETLRLYDGVLQQGRLRIEQRLQRPLPFARVDAEQLRQVIINLVDNAIEAFGGPAAPPRPNGDPATIVVATEYEAVNAIVRVTITDNGPGVPPADRDKLFMPYYSTKGRGSGLGLAIVRRIIVEHGGSIEVSDAQPVGTRFTVELPAG